MTITTSSYTTNSKLITIANETSPTGITAAVDTAITSLGWTQYDYIAAGSSTVVNGVANTWSPVFTYVYRALCADGVYYKYFIIRWNPTKSWFHTSVCESWNTSTHVPTNESHNFGMAFPQGYDLKDCSILVSGTAYHLMIFPWVRGVAGLWSACFEFERVASEDTTGVPCFAWTNSVMFGTPYGVNASNTASSYMLAFPRTANGNTGFNAASTYTTSTNRGTFPPNYPQGTITLSDSNGNALHLASFYNITYGWDNTKTIVSPISAEGRTVSMPFGRGYNIGITKSFGTSLDTTTVKGAVTGGWPDNAGSNTSYLILPLNGGNEADANAWSLNVAGRPSITGYAQLGTVNSVKSILVGNTAWIAASDGIRTWDSSQTAAGSTTTLRYTSATPISDVIFDGYRTIYAVNATAIIRIDTETYNTGTVALANGGFNLGIDGAYVYATSRTASTSPSCYVVNRWSTTDGSTGTGFTLVATYTLATTLTTVATMFGPPNPDYKGSCFVFTVANTANAQTFRIAKFTSSSGAQLVNAVAPGLQGTFSYSGYNFGNYWYNYISDSLQFYAINTVSSSTYLNAYVLNQSTLATSYSSPTLTVASTNVLSRTIISTYSGELQITPYKGILTLTNRNISFVNPTWTFNKVLVTQDAANAVINSISINNSTGYELDSIVGGGSSGNTTNGTSIIGGIYFGASDNRIYYQKDFYQPNNSIGGITGRLLLKA